MRIRQLGDPILREVSKPVLVEQIASLKVQGLINKMQSILDGIKAISDENGNALSAPQVGHLLRLIVLRIDGVFSPMINPEFTPTSDKTFEFEEECFSAYDKRATTTRYHEIKLSYLDATGAKRMQVLSAEESGLVQHEIDHLDGIVFLDRVEQSEVQTIDAILRDNPERLAQVKKMMAYMAG